MSPVAALNGSAIRSALSGIQRPAVGGGSMVPRFGPRVAAAPTKAPSPMSIGGSAAAPDVADMLSRPKRAGRMKGYSKTAPIKGGASLGPKGPASSGPGTGGY
jgi:hypothetical protein